MMMFQRKERKKRVLLLLFSTYIFNNISYLISAFNFISPLKCIMPNDMVIKVHRNLSNDGK